MIVAHTHTHSDTRTLCNPSFVSQGNRSGLICFLPVELQCSRTFFVYTAERDHNTKTTDMQQLVDTVETAHGLREDPTLFRLECHSVSAVRGASPIAFFARQLAIQIKSLCLP